MKAESTIVIGGTTIRTLLSLYHDANNVPTVVEFASGLDFAEQYDPAVCEWYTTNLAQLLVYVGRSAMGEDPDILALELFANSERS